LVVPVCANPVIVRVREKFAGVFFIGFGITLAFSK
jgi:threonine/homoserine/homoserine lactone efflux protein